MVTHANNESAVGLTTLERMTRFELATLTLARLCATTAPHPRCTLKSTLELYRELSVNAKPDTHFLVVVTLFTVHDEVNTSKLIFILDTESHCLVNYPTNCKRESEGIDQNAKCCEGLLPELIK